MECPLYMAYRASELCFVQPDEKNGVYLRFLQSYAKNQEEIYNPLSSRGKLRELAAAWERMKENKKWLQYEQSN